jgi:hypothetical protein
MTIDWKVVLEGRKATLDEAIAEGESQERERAKRKKQDPEPRSLHHGGWDGNGSPC